MLKKKEILGEETEAVVMNAVNDCLDVSQKLARIALRFETRLTKKSLTQSEMVRLKDDAKELMGMLEKIGKVIYE